MALSLIQTYRAVSGIGSIESVPFDSVVLSGLPRCFVSLEFGDAGCFALGVVFVDQVVLATHKNM